MDHPTITQIEKTGYPFSRDTSIDDVGRSCDLCDEPFVLMRNHIKYCRQCAKDAGLLRVNRDSFYPDTLHKEDQNDSD